MIVPAGVRPGALHQIRRSGATQLAKQDGLEAARQYLGHRTDAMVWHYVDVSSALGPMIGLLIPLGLSRNVSTEVLEFLARRMRLLGGECDC